MVAETHAMTIRLSGNVYEGLRNAAFVKRTTMTALIEEALQAHIPTFIAAEQFKWVQSIEPAGE